MYNVYICQINNSVPEFLSANILDLKSGLPLKYRQWRKDAALYNTDFKWITPGAGLARRGMERF